MLLSDKYLHFFHSEHTSFPDYKGSGGQRRTDCIFPLHRQWTQKGQFPPLASGEVHFPCTSLHSRSKTRSDGIRIRTWLSGSECVLKRSYCLNVIFSSGFSSASVVPPGPIFHVKYIRSMSDLRGYFSELEWLPNQRFIQVNPGQMLASVNHTV